MAQRVMTSCGSKPAHAPASDADLIARCAGFDVLTRQFDAVLNARPENDDDAFAHLLSTITKKQQALLPGLIALRATTPQGIQTRAYSLALFAVEADASLDSGIPAQLAEALLRDALALASATTNPPPADNTELLALVAQFWADEARSDAFYAAHPWGDWIGADAVEHETFVALHRGARRRIAEIQATTLPGLIAKARIAERFSYIHELAEVDLSDDEAVAWSLARDLLAMGEGA